MARLYWACVWQSEEAATSGSFPRKRFGKGKEGKCQWNIELLLNLISQSGLVIHRKSQRIFHLLSEQCLHQAILEAEQTKSSLRTVEQKLNGPSVNKCHNAQALQQVPAGLGQLWALEQQAAIRRLSGEGYHSAHSAPSFSTALPGIIEVQRKNFPVWLKQTSHWGHLLGSGGF